MALTTAQLRDGLGNGEIQQVTITSQSTGQSTTYYVPYNKEHNGRPMRVSDLKTVALETVPSSMTSVYDPINNSNMAQYTGKILTVTSDGGFETSKERSIQLADGTNSDLPLVAPRPDGRRVMNITVGSAKTGLGN